jgi:hypothetical protein
MIVNESLLFLSWVIYDALDSWLCFHTSMLVLAREGGGLAVQLGLELVAVVFSMRRQPIGHFVPPPELVRE